MITFLREEEKKGDIEEILLTKTFSDIDMTEEKSVILDRLNILEKKHEFEYHSNNFIDYCIEDIEDGDDLNEKLMLSLYIVYSIIMSEFKTELLLKNSAENVESVLCYINEFVKLENTCKSL